MLLLYWPLVYVFLVSRLFLPPLQVPDVLLWLHRFPIQCDLCQAKWVGSVELVGFDVKFLLPLSDATASIANIHWSCCEAPQVAWGPVHARQFEHHLAGAATVLKARRWRAGQSRSEPALFGFGAQQLWQPGVAQVRSDHQGQHRTSAVDPVQWFAWLRWDDQAISSKPSGADSRLSISEWFCLERLAHKAKNEICISSKISSSMMAVKPQKDANRVWEYKT